MSGQSHRLGSDFFLGSRRARGTCASGWLRLRPPSFTMEIISFRRGAIPLLCLAFLFAACGKKTKTTATSSPSPSAAGSAAKAAGPTPAPPIAGPVTPAVVTRNADSISHYLHFPEDSVAASRDSVVQFYCDINEVGVVEATYGLVGKDETFRAVVQSALDWGRFAPATVNGKPVAVYLGGTVIFTHDKGGAPVIAVSLATHDRERVGKLANFIQPQLVGGLRREVAKIIRQIPHNSPVAGLAQAVVEIDQRGALTSASVVGENPKGSGLGDLLSLAIKGAQFTHAFQDGKAVVGAVDVVADFSKL